LHGTTQIYLPFEDKARKIYKVFPTTIIHENLFARTIIIFLFSDLQNKRTSKLDRPKM
jgi:hypothetical protein